MTNTEALYYKQLAELDINWNFEFRY